MYILNKLRKPVILFPLLLILIELILFFTNFKSGTYLIGWDNIMPELNLSVNFERSVFSIWQEYRGLGVLDGLSHAANFFHTIYIFLLSIILPENAVRYAFISITHLVGGISFFFLLRKLTKNLPAGRHGDSVSFLGSLFYMFNIGVMQMYFAPLEVFATHFAALPLLALLITNTLEKVNAKNALLLFIGTLLVSQQGFVPTVFIAFGFLFGFLLLVNIIKTRKIKSALVVFAVVILASAFWLFPYSYSAFNTAENIANSRINQFSSEEIFFRNKAFGNFQSVLALKGFMIDTIELDPQSFRNTYFMQDWRSLTEGYIYQGVYLVFLALMIGGAALTILKRRLDFLPYLLTFFVGFIFLANDTPVFAQLNNFIRDTFPLIGEAFRFPFTKFITLFSFSFSVLFTLGLFYLISKLKKYNKAIYAGIFALLIIISYPAFLGNFTSPYLKLEVPKDYNEFYTYLNGQENTKRVALFPVQTFWNWQYRTWGQRGSGFIWHGISQPILGRAFDPWSPYNEQFYNEISFAVNTQDQILFDQLIRKYDISYIVLDQYILNSLSRKEINYESLKRFLDRSTSVEKDKEFGRVILYKTNLSNGWVYSLNKDTTKKVFSNYSFENLDSIYGLTDNYIASAKEPNVINLFPSLFSEKLQEDLEFEFQNLKKEYILTPKESKPYILDNYVLRVPSLFETEFLVPVEVKFSTGSLTLTPIYPEIYINGIRLNIEEEEVTIQANTILSPVSITFVDTNQTVNLDENSKAYILNPALNSIKLIDRLGRSELLILDTQEIDRRSFFANLPEGKIKDVEIRIPKIKSSLSSTTVIEDKDYEIRERSTGPFSKPFSFTKSQEESSGITLSARDGSTELTYYLPNLYHAGSYILFSKIDYKSGLPIRFYVDNDTETKAEVDVVFSKENNETVVVIPKTNDFFKGYGFHFTVKSVGKELSESTINSIESYPFPLKMLRSLQFIDKDSYARPINLNPKLPVEYNKLNINQYVAEAKPNSYLVLSQAYDEGWKAYAVKCLPAGEAGQMSNVKCQILAKALPFFFGDELENHVVVNNWANGWEIENVKCLPAGEAGQMSNVKCQIVIIYLPSYIQHLGQLISIGTFLILVFAILKKYGRNRRRKSG